MKLKKSVDIVYKSRALKEAKITLKGIRMTGNDVADALILKMEEIIQIQEKIIKNQEEVLKAKDEKLELLGEKANILQIHVTELEEAFAVIKSHYNRLLN